MSRATTLGDAVVTSLNEADFSIDFTSTRRYRIVYELKDLKDLTVTVLVPAVTQSIASRSTSLDTTIVDVMIQQQVDSSDNDAVDALIDLAEEVAEHFRNLDIADHSWVETEIVTFYDMEDMSDFRLFSSLVRVTYRCSWVK